MMKHLFLLLFTLITAITVSAKDMPRIHVDGKNFVDDNGKTVIFKGLCFSDPVKLISENKWEKAYFNEASSWNANIVRVPIHPQNINRHGWDKTFKAIDQGIAWAKELGMYVITDWNYTLSTQGRYFKKYLQSQEPNALAPMKAFRNISFAKAPTAGGATKDLKINIWKGKGNGAQPVVLFVHGGAWVSGDNNLDASGSEQIKALMELRDKGVTIAAATYRFSNEAIFPAQIHDVKAAIRFLKANAEKYGIDSDRIMTMGESAGAQLALLAAVSNGEEALEGVIGGNLHVDSKVIGCVDCYGMTDFLTLASDLYARKDLGRTDEQVYELVEDKNSSRSQLFGLTTDKCNLGTVTAKPKKFPKEYELVKQGSPIFHVTPDDPPILIINGQKDIRVPSAQAIKMYEALYDAGVEAELILNDRAPHGNLGAEAAASIKSFVLRILFPKN